MAESIRSDLASFQSNEELGVYEVGGSGFNWQIVAYHHFQESPAGFLVIDIIEDCTEVKYNVFYLLEAGMRERILGVGDYVLFE